MTTAATLRSLLLDAHRGSFPPVDGGWTRITPWRSGLGAVIAFTGHAVMAVDDDVEDHDLLCAPPTSLACTLVESVASVRLYQRC